MSEGVVQLRGGEIIIRRPDQMFDGRVYGQQRSCLRLNPAHLIGENTKIRQRNNRSKKTR